MNGPFDLIIFDYDGVIADSELLNNAVMAELLTEIGLPTTLDDALASYLGKRWLDCEPIIAERLGAPCPSGVREEWTRRCHDRAKRELNSVAGFEVFLGGRTERHCVASSSPPDWIEMGLRRFDAYQTFDASIFSAAVHVNRGKPHPDLFLYAAQAMGVTLVASVPSLVKATRPKPDDMAAIVEDLIKLLDSAGNELRRHRYPSAADSRKLATLLRGVADSFDVQE